MARVSPREYSDCCRWLYRTGRLQRLHQWSKLLELTAKWVGLVVYDAFCGRHATNKCFDEAFARARRAVKLYLKLLEGYKRFVEDIWRERPSCASVVEANCARCEAFARDLLKLIDDAITATRDWLSLPYTKGLRRRLQCAWLDTLVRTVTKLPCDQSSITIELAPTPMICEDGGCGSVGLHLNVKPSWRAAREKMRRFLEWLVLERMQELWSWFLATDTHER